MLRQDSAWHAGVRTAGGGALGRQPKGSASSPREGVLRSPPRQCRALPAGRGGAVFQAVPAVSEGQSEGRICPHTYSGKFWQCLAVFGSTEALPLLMYILSRFNTRNNKMKTSVRPCLSSVVLDEEIGVEAGGEMNRVGRLRALLSFHRSGSTTHNGRLVRHTDDVRVRVCP